MKFRRSHLKLPCLAALIFAPGWCRADFFQAPYGPGGTWRVYETFPGETLTFKDAWLLAQERRDPVTNTAPGHLISITSRGKEIFASRSLNFAAGDMWIGLTDREGVAEGAEESIFFGTADDAHRKNGWKWTNGDPYEYYNWGAGEPNNAGSGEDAVHFNTGAWNDNQSGFDEDDPIPGSNSTFENNSPPLYRFIIEYSTNSPTPFPGIRHGSVFPPDFAVNLPPNTDGNWSVREVRDLPLARNIFDSVDQLLSGEGTIIEGQVPYLDLTDPDTNGGGGPSLSTPPIPFLSDNPGVDDDDILLMAKTRVKIPAAGEYTFQVRSDDGFALRVKGQSWAAVSGAGYIDPLDPSTMVFETGTGDANTRGVLNLAAGEYDVELVMWEGGGGAFCEVTSATGARLNAAEAQWLPLGSSATLAPVNNANAVYLKSAATVYNANLRDRNNVLPAMRNIIETAIADGIAVSDTREEFNLNEGDMPDNNGGDQYITKVEGKITVAADANGNGVPGETIDVTFGIFADDGASLRIIGQDFKAVNDFDGDATHIASLVEIDGDMVFTADYYTGNTNAYGLISLQEGQTYDFVGYMYEGGGGSYFRVQWEIGDLTATGFGGGQTTLRTADWAPDDAIFMPAPATVTNTPHDTTPPFLPQAREIMKEAVAQNAVQTGTAPLLIINQNAPGEPGTGSVTGGAYSGTRVVMPVGSADNFLTRVNGRFVVDNQNGVPGETLTLTFGVFADDGADFRIIGQDFFSVTGNGTPAILEEIDGDDSIVADFDTGNTNAFGTITLVEGEYDFEGHMYEHGGEALYEVWWALGEHTSFNSAFRPLSVDPGLILPANTGLQLVAASAQPPPAGPLAVTNFTFNAATGAYSLSFTSEAGKNYALEYTIGFQAAGDPPSPEKWNIAPGKGSIPGAAGTTTVTGNISELLAPGGQLPNASKAFFRVRSL